MDWLSNKEMPSNDTTLADVQLNQLWKKYTANPGRKGNEAVFCVKSINKNSVVLKALLNQYGEEKNISIDILRRDYILTNESQVRQMPRYQNFNQPDV